MPDEPLHPQRPARKYIEPCIGIIILAAAFDDRGDRAVVDSRNRLVVVLVTVALEHGGNFARLLQNIADHLSVLHAVLFGHVESLMGDASIC